MLDAHPDLAIPPESYFITSLSRYAEEFDLRDFQEALVRHERFALWEIPDHEVTDALRRSSPQTYGDAVRAVYALYAERHGKPRYGDKTPRYSIDLPFLANLFPDGRFIHIIRDGRDVSLSLMDVRLGRGHIREAARLWRSRVSAARRDGEQLGPDRYREVRYETLIDDPESTLRSLCGFIDLPFNPRSLMYYSRVGEMPNPGLAIRYKPGHQSHVGEPPRKGLRDWRTQMNPHDLAVFEADAGALLDELGYERGMRKIPIVTALRERSADVLQSARMGLGSVAKRLVPSTR
jgi:Sulfotransferase family